MSPRCPHLSRWDAPRWMPATRGGPPCPRSPYRRRRAIRKRRTGSGMLGRRSLPVAGHLVQSKPTHAAALGQGRPTPPRIGRAPILGWFSVVLSWRRTRRRSRCSLSSVCPVGVLCEELVALGDPPACHAPPACSLDVTALDDMPTACSPDAPVPVALASAAPAAHASGGPPAALASTSSPAAFFSILDVTSALASAISSATLGSISYDSAFSTCSVPIDSPASLASIGSLAVLEAFGSKIEAPVLCTADSDQTGSTGSSSRPRSCASSPLGS